MKYQKESQLIFSKYKFGLPLWFCFLLTLISNSVFADEDPVQMLQSVTSKVMTVLKENRPTLKRNPERIYDVVNQYILPHADFVEMSRWVIGRNAWQQADANTQKAFVEEFKTLVIRSYAQSLLNYTDQTVDFLPLRGSTEGKNRVQVATLIKQKGKNPVRIEYRLLKTSDGWKVYDIIIEGVSLMQGYRSQFNQDLQQGGVSHVLQKLKQHNRSSAQSRGAKK